MKRIYCIIFTVLIAFTLCSCSPSKITDGSHNGGSGTGNDSLLNTANSPQKITGNFDRVVMTVTTDKTEYAFDEIIKVTASVKNVSNETVRIAAHTSDSVTDHGIYTTITLNGRCLHDSVRTAELDNETGTVYIEPNEEYVREMNFETYFATESGKSGERAEEGLYSGKCTITLLDDPSNTSEQCYKGYSLNFSLILGSETDPQHEISENKPQTFTKDYDGIVMTVTTDKTKYLFDEIIKVTASVKNVGNETLNLFVPTSSPNTHQEIYTTITHNGNYLCDPVTIGAFNDGTATIYIEPGQEYVQEMNYETYYFSSNTLNPGPRAEEGLYSGKCTISLRIDPNDTSKDSFKHYSLDFSLVIGSESDPQHELCENKPQTFTHDHDGIIMTVKTDKRRYEIDEPIRVEASVKNTTDKAIHLFVPCLGDSHKQISTKIHNGYALLIDVDTFMQFYDQMIDVVTIEPNEEYTQSMTYETYIGIDTSSRKQAEGGLYLGKSIIQLFDDYPVQSFSDAEYTFHSLDFSLVVGSPSFAQPQQPEVIENTPQTVTEDFDGIVLTVKTDKKIYKLNDSINVEASVKNTTNEEIYLYVSGSNTDCHREILTEILVACESLIDIDTFMKDCGEGMHIMPLAPNEEYTQSMVFETYLGDNDTNRRLAEDGYYSGKSTIMLIPDPDNISFGDFVINSVVFDLTLE